MRSSALAARIVLPAALTHKEIECWRGWQREDGALATAFLSYPYTMAAAEIFGGVRVCCIIRNRRTVAFFPFQYSTLAHRFFGIGQRIGGELSDYFGIVAEPDLLIAPPELLRLARLNAVYFTHLDETQQRYGLVGDSAEIGLRTDLSRRDGLPAWEALRHANKKFAADTDRCERKLAREYGPLRFVFAHDEPATPLAHLVAMKRAQYARTKVADPLCSSRSRQFIARLSASRDPDCRGVLSTLHAGDTWAASHFGLMHGGILHYWFPVYNPELRSFSPGRLLYAAMMREAPAYGLCSIDQGAGDSPAKRDFATEEHKYQRGVWWRPGTAATVYRLGLTARWRVRAIYQSDKARA